MSSDNHERDELLERGFDAIFSALGLVDGTRFIQLLRPATGDYTAERHERQDRQGATSVDDLIREMNSARQKQTEPGAGREPAAVSR